MTVGGGPCRTASAGIADTSGYLEAIDNCSGVGLPGSFTKLTTECDPQCAQIDPHSSYYSEKLTNFCLQLLVDHAPNG
jgi:hypothetical protein